jgi:hypothetical protein
MMKTEYWVIVRPVTGMSRRHGPFEERERAELALVQLLGRADWDQAYITKEQYKEEDDDE